jgi:hypothetical protein
MSCGGEQTAAQANSRAVVHPDWLLSYGPLQSRHLEGYLCIIS